MKKQKVDHHQSWRNELFTLTLLFGNGFGGFMESVVELDHTEISGSLIRRFSLALWKSLHGPAARV